MRRDHFACVPCAKEGKRTYSREVDHIIEIADGGDEFDVANTQTICKRHHKQKTAESRRIRALNKRLKTSSILEELLVFHAS